MRKKLFAILPLLILSYCHCSAQSPRKYSTQYHGWYMYFGDHRFSQKLGVHLEAQWRRDDIIKSPQQLLLRTGINYHFSQSAFSTLGYCFVNTYPYGDLPAKATFPEHRIWEQLQFRSLLGKIEAINRIRLEQRFVNVPILEGFTYKPGPSVYANRIRLLNRFSLPINRKEIVDKTFYLTVYNEFLISFGKNVSYNLLDQNRAYGALGYKIPKVGRLEVGYLNQLLFKSNGIDVENNHTLQVGLSSTLDFFKKVQ